MCYFEPYLRCRRSERDGGHNSIERPNRCRRGTNLCEQLEADLVITRRIVSGRAKMGKVELVDAAVAKALVALSRKRRCLERDSCSATTIRQPLRPLELSSCPWGIKGHLS